MILLSIKVNGIKKITNLTAASTINDADVFMIETTSGSRKVTGAVLKTLINNLAPDIDATLSTTGQAADAKATGDAIQAVQAILPVAPTTDGNYVLTVTVTDGTPTYTWTLQA